MPPQITLIIGGIASGKSKYAEKLVRSYQLPRIYIATAQALDGEMKAKIIKHQAARGKDWITIETPLKIAETLLNSPANHIILLECLTFWLSNHLLQKTATSTLTQTLLDALHNCPSPVIAVSNDIGNCPIAANQLARQFCQRQGELNQAVAYIATHVINIHAGIPVTIKNNS